MPVLQRRSPPPLNPPDGHQWLPSTLTAPQRKRPSIPHDKRQKQHIPCISTYDQVHTCGARPLHRAFFAADESMLCVSERTSNFFFFGGGGSSRWAAGDIDSVSIFLLHVFTAPLTEQTTARKAKGQRNTHPEGTNVNLARRQRDRETAQA